MVVAFDGGLFDTLGVRSDAVAESAIVDGWTIDRTWALTTLPGRSLHECVLLSAAFQATMDHTLADLIAMRAQRLVSDRMARGVTFVNGAGEWLNELRNRGTRVVLRADSVRRDVEPLLRQAELDFAFAVVRCVDDLPRDGALSSLQNSYRAITRRLDALGESTERYARECTPEATAVARSFLGFGEPTA